ncbi:substrate-binding periplasmic protein [Bowmanella denitrificans]|uniref:substrate-binding periplasmic protein n=1 Tax=Bowmanella denitrificans TaxID=366582 RepID=UPI000C9BB83D|nr:transporter substrate-binding domain-containing protein [Bowmanella denitrificans]
MGSFCLSIPAMAQAIEHTIYTYHSDPPFYLPEQPSDLSRAWVDRFNLSQEQIKLRLLHIERAALNQLIEQGKPYLILWANPVFFHGRDAAMQASEAIFWDADILLSRADSPLEYHVPADLIGLRLGARRGFYYKGINELVEQGKITRLDVDTDNQNYRRLLSNDIDVFIMQRSAYYYWRVNGLDVDLLYVAKEPHDGYSRHVLGSAQQAQVLQQINRFIRDSHDNPNWRAQLMKWGVEGLMNPFELELEELMEVDLDKQ